MKDIVISTLTTNWSFMRYLRLGLGLLIGFQAYQSGETISGFIAALFLFQAFTNTGCCGAGGCVVPLKSKSSKEVETVYEEVK